MNGLAECRSLNNNQSINQSITSYTKSIVRNHANWSYIRIAVLSLLTQLSDVRMTGSLESMYATWFISN